MTGALTTSVAEEAEHPVPDPVGPGVLSEDDLAALRSAVRALERSTLTGRLSGLAGRPIEMLGQFVPDHARAAIAQAADVALRTALKLALRTLRKTDDPLVRDGRARSRSGRVHTALAAASGAFGGALGLMTLPIELPVSTTLILRSIADIARHEGEDLARPETALACLEVFALGSRAETDDLSSSGYFAVRGALAKSISEAAKLAAGRGFADRSAPALVRFLSQVASRFGIVVSQKVAAGAVPVLGAFGGAAINAAFAEHFRTVATAHFTVRRLERRYGAEAVRAAYDGLRETAGRP